MAENLKEGTSNVVLVHGGFVDGSGWEAVYNILKDDGYNVAIVQNPTISLEGDVAATKLILAAQDGPVILVGHSYGGVVITEAGNDPKVAGLVYIAAFAPDLSKTRRQVLRCRRSFRRKMVFYFLIVLNLRIPSPRMCLRKRRHLWPTRRFRGG